MKPLKTIVKFVYENLLWFGMGATVAGIAATVFGLYWSAGFLYVGALIADSLLAWYDRTTITRWFQERVRKPWSLVVLVGFLVVGWWIGGEIVGLILITGAIMGHIFGEF